MELWERLHWEPPSNYRVTTLIKSLSGLNGPLAKSFWIQIKLFPVALKNKAAGNFYNLTTTFCRQDKSNFLLVLLPVISSFERLNVLRCDLS